jgi:hypothetical protein
MSDEHLTMFWFLFVLLLRIKGGALPAFRQSPRKKIKFPES